MMRTLLRSAGLLPLLLAMVCWSPLPGQTAERVPVTGAVVAAALATAGIQANAAAIEMPAALFARGSADPLLRPTAAELLPDGRIRVHMACGRSGACLPFLAAVQTASPTQAAADLLCLQQSLEPTGALRANPLTAAHLLAGQHVTMLLEDPHMRITMPVLAVDSGAPGTEVRVSSLDHKQIFHAVVADAGTVRGTLP